MKHVYRLGAWLGVFLSILMIPQLSFCDEILFHELIFNHKLIETTMYSVNDDGSGPVKLGDGEFAKRSPDKTYLSYIKLDPPYYRFETWGDLVIKNVKSGEVIPVQNFSRVDCNKVQCNIIMRQPGHKKTDSVVLPNCTINYCWNPDSTRVAYATILGLSMRDGFVYVFDVKTRKATRLHHFKYHSFTTVPWGISMSWSPDGKRLLFNTADIETKDINKLNIYLIDPETQTKKSVENGCLPRFVDNKTIIFSTGATIWRKNIETGEKTKVIDIQGVVSSISRVRQNRVLLQVAPGENPTSGPSKLYSLNIETHQLKQINVENYIFYCPHISPDGKKMTVIGADLAEKRFGYFVYDFQTKKVILLKALNIDENSRGLLMGTVFGYGNHAHWD